MLDAVEFLCSAQTRLLTAYQLGRLMEKVCKAVVAGDESFLKQFSFIGRVYWRKKYCRPGIPASVKRAVLERDGAACVLCGRAEPIHLDHYVPWSKGGVHSVDNLRVLCAPCNYRKGASMPESN